MPNRCAVEITIKCSNMHEASEVLEYLENHTTKIEHESHIITHSYDARIEDTSPIMINETTV